MKGQMKGQRRLRTSTSPKAKWRHTRATRRVLPSYAKNHSDGQGAKIETHPISAGAMGQNAGVLPKLSRHANFEAFKLIAYKRFRGEAPLATSSSPNPIGIPSNPINSK